MEQGIGQYAEDAVRGSADPERALRNLERWIEAAHGSEGLIERALPWLREAARLFSASQFLANHCARSPEALAEAFEALDIPLTREEVFREADSVALPEDQDGAMRALRNLKKRLLLRITLRDLAGRTQFAECAEELSHLADALIAKALAWAVATNVRRHGEPSGEGLALIALGKLGGLEINYSSDVDLIAVYGADEGETEGVVSPSGVRMSRITNHEFYVKAVETVSRLLSRDTEDGICYRVDFRLRPQGQKGELALPLHAYRAYYGTWARTWERMVLIRARIAAGDADVGAAFIQIADDFVWKRAVDYTEMEEIRAMKRKIDSTFTRGDIKRGYGGIREAEFFIQTFQLIYGPEHRALRTYRLLNALQSLRRMGLLPPEEATALAEAYAFLRRTEHFLQMLDDLQTYTLPDDAAGMDALARKMGFRDGAEFSSDLKVRRMKIKDMYNSLLGSAEDAHAEAMTLLEGDVTEQELEAFLSYRGLRDLEAARRAIGRLREHMASMHTPGHRAVMRRVVPEMMDRALREPDPDRALAGVEGFFTSYGGREAYLTALVESPQLGRGLTKTFALSTWLTRMALSRDEYLNRLVEGMPIRKPLARHMADIGRVGGGLDELALYRNAEWLRLGMFFLLGIIPADTLNRGLSALAATVLASIRTKTPAPEGFAVIAMGKLGGRELTFGSDLDIIYVSERPYGHAVAEEITRALATYTERGTLYEVDTRLRPDGGKGALVKDIAGYRAYYMDSARGWEVQALLRARPLSGDPALCRAFMEMRAQVLSERGPALDRAEVSHMRERIVRELAVESKGLDIKLGPGGMGEIEFFVQWLALHSARSRPECLIQHTGLALRRMGRAGLIGRDEARTLAAHHAFYAKLLALMRLNDIDCLDPSDGFSRAAALFMGYPDTETLDSAVKFRRTETLRLINAH